jgi:DNA-binding NtrC family response regulator
VIMITAHGTEQIAVEAMKAGAEDYVPKPFDNDELRIVVARALERSRLRREHRLLLDRVSREHGFGAIVGSGPAMRALFERIQKVAETDLTVLVRGESGAGKELVAQALDEHSARARRPFVAARLGRPRSRVSDAAMARLGRHPWPGNERELRNLLEQAAVLASGETIEEPDLRLPRGEVAPTGGRSTSEQPATFAEAKRQGDRGVRAVFPDGIARAAQRQRVTDGRGHRDGAAEPPAEAARAGDPGRGFPPSDRGLVARGCARGRGGACCADHVMRARPG